MHGVKDSMVFLAYYYGVPEVFKTDSAWFKNGEADLKSNDPDFIGGIYVLFLSDYKTKFEVLMNKGDDMTIAASAESLPLGINITNSDENVRFCDYNKYITDYATRTEHLKKQLTYAKTTQDSNEIRNMSKVLLVGLKKYRKDYETKYKGTLLAKIFNAIKDPEVLENPTNSPFQSYENNDPNYPYKYYKMHFWDGFDFQDDRLIFAPIYNDKLKQYFETLIIHSYDSLVKEADILLEKSKGTRHVFKYTLWWITRFTENNKTFKSDDLDNLFVYLVQKYYINGAAYWLTDEQLSKYTDKVKSLKEHIKN